MTRGRKPIAVFGSNTRHINEIATTATNLGAYTVESLAPGLYYFIDGDHVVLATGNGYMKMHITTAGVIAKELPDILADFEESRREGRVQMDTRAIQRMLRV